MGNYKAISNLLNNIISNNYLKESVFLQNHKQIQNQTHRQYQFQNDLH